ncbi:hypothetical protein EJV47_10530 [Hymenobacter gummosus]|uniref:Uncharacterized protein n=1 Tax=Hymenobacter gummosus TaxID=1776032 RepID=A0A431U3B1_9BACT|nr:hypothetical protein [Hymenobacter gummosus]RTQ50068.1 hypothetical protein EJV47_10530 [Hymenobacter gummosus]
MSFVSKSHWILFLLLICGWNAKAQRPPADLSGYLDISALPGRKFLVESEGTRYRVPRRTVLVNVLVSLADIKTKYGVASQLPVRYDRDSLLLVFAAVEGNPGFPTQQLWMPYEDQPLLNPKTFFTDCLGRLDLYKREGYSTYNDITRCLYIKPVVTIKGTRQTLGGIVLTEPFLVMPIPFLVFGQSDNVTINTLSPALSEALMYTSFENYNKYYNTNAETLRGILPSKILLQRLDKGLYYFWAYPPNLMDGPSHIHGAEKFVYRPGVGILTGTYSNFTEAEGRDFKVTRITRLK